MQLTYVLASAAGAGVLVALGGGWLLARRGMRPVRDLAETVGRIRPDDPALVLNGEPVPAELAPIVDTTQRLLERIRGELIRQRQLTADVAHDLRTPVAGVRTLLDVCMQRERSAEEYTSTIAKARAALRQLSTLLDDVLTLSRVEAGGEGLRLETVSLGGAVNGAVSTVEPLAAARDVRIVSDGLPPELELRTDEAKLVKILGNLLSNAVEHSPTGAVVRIAAAVRGPLLEIEVVDQGSGVSPEVRERIFERFVRGDASRSSANGHHGLGLPIAAGLARSLGGRVRLDATWTPGSRFVVELPL
jgi:two-component system heavy metal sensor histidine kinase CusS